MSQVINKSHVSKSKYILALTTWISVISIFSIVNVYLLILNRGLISHQSFIVYDLIKLPFYVIPFISIWYGFKIKEKSKVLNFIKVFITSTFLLLASLLCLFFFLGTFSDFMSGSYKDFNKGYDQATHTLIQKIEFPNTTLEVFLVMGGGAAGYMNTIAVLHKKIGLGFIHNVKYSHFEYCENTKVEKISDTKVRIYGCDEEMIMKDIN